MATIERDALALLDDEQRGKGKILEKKITCLDCLDTGIIEEIEPDENEPGLGVWVKYPCSCELGKSYRMSSDYINSADLNLPCEGEPVDLPVPDMALRLIENTNSVLEQVMIDVLKVFLGRNPVNLDFEKVKLAHYGGNSVVKYMSYNGEYLGTITMSLNGNTMTQTFRPAKWSPNLHQTWKK